MYRNLIILQLKKKELQFFLELVLTKCIYPVEKIMHIIFVNLKNPRQKCPATEFRVTWREVFWEAQCKISTGIITLFKTQVST